MPNVPSAELYARRILEGGNVSRRSTRAVAEWSLDLLSRVADLDRLLAEKQIAFLFQQRRALALDSELDALRRHRPTGP